MISWEIDRIIIIVTVTLCLVAAIMAFIAKNVWGNRRLTVAFSAVGIVSVIIFIATSWEYLPD